MAIPFEVLDRRFGKYLEFGYIARMVSGVVITLEVAALFEDGDSSTRRAGLREHLEDIPFRGRGVVAQVLLAFLSAFAFYAVGRVARMIWSSVSWRLFEVGAWVNVILGDPLRHYRKVRQRRSARRLRHADGTLHRRPLQVIRTPPFDLDALANFLNYTLEPLTLQQLFRSHHLRFLEDSPAASLSRALPYAVTWLRRNGKGWSVATPANAALLYDAAAVPAALIPATLGALTAFPTGGLPVEILAGALLGRMMIAAARRASVNAESSLLFEFVMSALVAMSEKGGENLGGVAPEAATP